MINRTFIPGSEWLYLRLYTGKLSADDILMKWLLPVYNSLVQSESIVNMFFLRYMDPEYHLRIRFQIRQKCFAYVMEIIKDSLLPYIENNIIWKVEFGTYEREIERYSSECIENIEKIFACDSLYSLKSMVFYIPSTRWKLSCTYIEQLFSILKYSLPQKASTMDKMQKSFRKELGIDDSNFTHKLNYNYRALRGDIEEIMSHPFDEHFYELSKIINSENSIQISKHVCDIIHMINNRLFLAFPRQNEAVLYYYLYKTYSSQLARTHEK